MIAAVGQAAARHPDRVAALGLFALVCLLFTPAVLGERVFFRRDIYAYWYPHMENAVQAVAEGAWPTWTPYVAFGRPLLADPSLQLLYPPTWLNLLMRPSTYYTVFVVAHCWAAGLGLYLLARRLGLGPLPAGLAGGLWTASGPLLSAVNLFHHFAGAAWIPWVLLMLVRALDAPGLRSGVLLGAAAGGQALAGSADMCLLTAVAAAFYAAGFVWSGPGRRSERVAACARVGITGVVLAASLGAAQWLPALALLKQGARAAQDFAVSSTWSVHPASLADMVVPRLVADLPSSAELRAAFFDGRGPLLVSLYMGAASVPLVLLAMAGPADPVRRWAALALVFFVVAALGRHTVLYRFLAAAPPLSLLRYPAKYMLPASMFWALLAGLGLEVWTNRWSDPARRGAKAIVVACGTLAVAALIAACWLRLSPATPGGVSARDGAVVAASKVAIAGGALLSATALLGARVVRSRLAGGLTVVVCALVVGDAVWAGRRVNPLAPSALYRYRAPAAARIASDGPDARLYVRQESADRLNELLVRGPGGWDSEEGWALGAADLLVPPIGARWRLAGSYDGDFTGLASPALSVFSLILPAVAAEEVSLKLLRLAAVTHVAALRERPFPGLTEVAVFPSVFRLPVRLFRVPDPLPRVYAVGGARTAPTENQALTVMGDPRFDLRREIVLPETTPVHGAADGFLAATRVVSRRTNALDVEVEMSHPGWLVVVEGYEPGWTARADGEPVPLLRANALFRAVPVPAGTHRVEMRYRPPGLRAGILLTAAAVVASLAAVAARARAGRSNANP